MATINRPIMLLLTVIQISNKILKFDLNKVVYLCLLHICTKLQVDTSFLSWVLFNNLTSICSIWRRPWNHSTNIFICIFFIALCTLLVSEISIKCGEAMWITKSGLHSALLYRSWGSPPPPGKASGLEKCCPYQTWFSKT